MTPQDIFNFHQWFQSSFQHLLAARYTTFYQALMLAVGRNAKVLVETGTARQPGNWVGDGQSTCVLGAFAQRYAARVHTCDISASNIAAARELTKPFSGQIDYVVGDSIEFLRRFAGPIDLLYLDSFDFDQRGDPNPPQDHAVREAQAALHALHSHSIILIDDCNVVHGGKGGKVIPFLLGEGWQVIGVGYQVLMTHAYSGETAS